MKSLKEISTAEEYLKEISNELQKNSLGNSLMIQGIKHDQDFNNGDFVANGGDSGGMFKLKNPVVISKGIPKLFKSNELIMRASFTEDMLSDEQWKNYLPIVVNRLIQRLEKELKFSKDDLNYGIYGTFECLEHKDKYTRQMEHPNRVEIRLYSHTKKV